MRNYVAYMRAVNDLLDDDDFEDDVDGPRNHNRLPGGVPTAVTVVALNMTDAIGHITRLYGNHPVECYQIADQGGGQRAMVLTPAVVAQFGQAVINA